jgi:hypothetical protein
MMTDAKRKSVWPTVIAIGCATVFVIVVAIAAIVAWNWPRLTGYYHQAKTAITELTRVSAALQSKYGGMVNLTVKRESGVAGSILSVTLTNPSFLDHFDPEAPSGRQQALEVAAAVRDALPPGSGYEHFEVIISRQQGSGVSVAKSWLFRFERSELPRS